MKRLSLLLGCLTLTACTTIETARKNGQEFANNLEKEQDVIETIDEYTQYTSRCDKYIKSMQGEWIMPSIILAPITIPAFSIYYISGSNNFLPYYTHREHCYSYDELAEKGIDFRCIESWRDSDYYNSDECIMLRRNLHESELGYFDYKRFLPKNTPVNTDEKFLALIKFYKTKDDCDKLENATTQEKQDCENKVIETTRQMATTGVKCMNAYPKEYKEFLSDKGSWFGWAIDHDPWETKKMVYYTGGAAAAYWIPEEPVYSKSEALKSITQSVAEWGQRHICDTTGWQAEIRKMGYKLN